MNKAKKKLKTKMVTRYIKYFTKPLLQEAAQNAEKWDFNRQLDLEAVNAIPDGRYPVELWFTHHHRHFRPAEEHIRAQVAMDAHKKFGVAFVDMPVEFWDRLPTYPVRIRKPVAKKRPSAGSGYGRWGSVCGYRPLGEPAFQEWLRQEIEKQKESELSPDARKTLAQVFKDQGAEWTYDALGRYYLPDNDTDKFKKNWKDERQRVAVMSLGAIVQTYTRKAIYDAASEIEKPADAIEGGIGATVAA